MSAESVQNVLHIVEQRGLFYEEFELSTRYLHRPGRTVTEADNVLFTTLTMNTQALHLDAEFAAQQPFGQRLVNSMLTLSTMVGASVAQLTQGTLVANLGFGAVSFPLPVFIGDTLYSETVVLEKRLSASRPGQGIIALQHTARNQHNELVASAERSTLVWCLGAQPASMQPAAQPLAQPQPTPQPQAQQQRPANAAPAVPSPSAPQQSSVARPKPGPPVARP